jgi:hypothetical protein
MRSVPEDVVLPLVSRTAWRKMEVCQKDRAAYPKLSRAVSLKGATTWYLQEVQMETRDLGQDT